MQSTTEGTLVDVVREHAHRLTGGADDYDRLLDVIGDARFVLLGEASHGTHEFYFERALITKRLLAEKGFHAVAIEGDWPDARRISRFVRSESSDAFAVDALGDFRRFPTWMWRNVDMVEFVDWLRDHNAQRPEDALKAGVYGLDLYSLHASMRAVLRYLQKVDRAAARAARERYSCFDHFGEDTQVYGLMLRIGAAKSCEEPAIEQLLELQLGTIEEMKRDGATDEEEAFYAEQNARVVVHAEQYYRSMFLRDVSTWNLRDEHMFETLAAIAAFLDRRVTRSKIVVWAHNSHVGDARATDMGRRGELNIGQLVRQRYPRDCVSVGFTTHGGTVTAASDWDAPAERKRVLPSRAGSYERVFHDTDIDRFMLALKGSADVRDELAAPRLERAIGVVYRPETERQSHYFNARLPDQFDVVLHFDVTRAVEPLEHAPQWKRGEAGELPETFPTGM